LGATRSDCRSVSCPATCNSPKSPPSLRACNYILRSSERDFRLLPVSDQVIWDRTCLTPPTVSLYPGYRRNRCGYGLPDDRHRPPVVGGSRHVSDGRTRRWTGGLAGWAATALALSSLFDAAAACSARCWQAPSLRLGLVARLRTLAFSIGNSRLFPESAAGTLSSPRENGRCEKRAKAHRSR
jgi:hypothetical protein